MPPAAVITAMGQADVKVAATIMTVSIDEDGISKAEILELFTLHTKMIDTDNVAFVTNLIQWVNLLVFLTGKAGFCVMSG